MRASSSDAVANDGRGRRGRRRGRGRGIGAGVSARAPPNSSCTITLVALLRGSQPNHVAVVERDASFHPLEVQEGAAGALEVVERRPGLVGHDLRVNGSDARRLQPEPAGGRRPDGDLLGLLRELEGLPVENPPEDGEGRKTLAVLAHRAPASRSIRPSPTGRAQSTDSRAWLLADQDRRTSGRSLAPLLYSAAIEGSQVSDSPTSEEEDLHLRRGAGPAARGPHHHRGGGEHGGAGPDGHDRAGSVGGQGPRAGGPRGGRLGARARWPAGWRSRASGSSTSTAARATTAGATPSPRSSSSTPTRTASAAG